MKRFILLLFAAFGVCLASSHAQTANDPNEGSRLEWDSANSIFRFSWWGRSGRTYFIQQNEDLTAPWSYVPIIEPGNNSVKEWGFASNGSKFFLRLRYSDIPTNDPWAADFDGDQVSNGDELAQGTDPFKNEDTDHDGLPDDWEIKHFGNLAQGANDDPDGDGLTNAQEFLYHTDPMDFGNRAVNPLGDSDGNGLADWWEILYFGTLGNNPNQTVAAKGGLTLKEIFDNDLDLTASSTSGDEIPDSWKLANGLDPQDPNVANEDADGDGLTNGDEYDAGTNPQAWDTDGDGIPDGQDLHPLIADPSAPGSFHVTVPTWDEQYASQTPDWSAVDYTSVELKWEASSNDPTGYKIERREDNDVWHEIATVSGTSQADSGLVANRHYQYRIWALKNAPGGEFKSQVASADYEVPLALRMSVKRSSLSRWKWSCGAFSEFGTRSTPPKYYLQSSDVSSFTSNDSGSGDNWSWTTNRDGQYSFTQSINPSQHSRTQVGSYSYSYDNSGHDSSGSYSSLSDDDSTYNWFDQKRGRGLLASTTQGDRNSSSSSSSSGYWGSSSSSSGNSGSYLYQGTYQPTGATVRWAGDDFDMSLGSVVYSGNSDYSDYSNYSSGSSSSSSGQATVNGLGQWSGSRTYNYSDGSSSTYSLSYPPWSGGWGYYGWFSNLTSETTTERNYSYSYASGNYSYNSQGTQTLSQEYTTGAFMADVINDLPDYPDQWDENWYGWGYYDWGYWGSDYYWGYEGWWYWYGWGYPWYGWWVADRHLASSEDSFSLSKMKYKLTANPSAQTTLKWSEVFVPDDDPATTDVDESKQIQIVRERTWQLTSGQNESPEFEIDPSTEQRGNGYYTILIQPVHVAVQGIGEAGKNVSGQDTAPGKVLLINDGDADNDGIPDYADGYDFNQQIEDDNECYGASFTPVYIGLYATDPQHAKIKFTYDASDPKGLTATSTDPYALPGTGKLRLWKKDAWGDWNYDTGEHVPRNPNSAKTGGDYIVPGVEYTFEELGITSYWNYFTVYAEPVKVSAAVADIPIKVEIDPTGSLGFQWSDQVRITGVKPCLFGKQFNETSYSIVDRFVPSGFRDISQCLTNYELTPSSYSTYKIQISDPRTTQLRNVLVSGQEVPISKNGNVWESNEFIVTPSLAGQYPSLLPEVARIALTHGGTPISYNGAWSWLTDPKVNPLCEGDKIVKNAIKRATDAMETSGWAGAFNGDFGTEVHKRVSESLGSNSRWAADVYVENETKRVLSIGTPPPGGTAGTTQIDLLYLKKGYRPKVGGVLQTEGVIDLYELKTSVSGRVDLSQKLRLKDVIGREIKVVKSERRWVLGSGWQKNPRFGTGIKVLGILAAATTAYAWVNVSSYDDEFEEIRQQVLTVRNESDPDDKRIENLILVDKIRNYLSHFTPDSTAVDVASVGVIYLKVLPGQEWELE